jgi:hypothetical protein
MVNVRIGSHKSRGGAMHDSPAGRPARPRADSRADRRADSRADSGAGRSRAHRRPRTDGRLAHLITELQGRGLRVEVPLESRQGGAGPADAGMLWVDGFAATVPTGAHYARTSPRTTAGPSTGTGSGWPRPSRPAAPATTTWPPPTASRTGRSPCCTWTRSPAPSTRPAPTGATPISARSAGSGSRSPTAGRSPGRPRRCWPRSRSRPGTWTARWTPP